MHSYANLPRYSRDIAVKSFHMQAWGEEVKIACKGGREEVYNDFYIIVYIASYIYHDHIIINIIITL